MGKLDGKTAIVTGATSGMGRAVAVRFAREGANIIAAGRDRGRGAEVLAEIEAAGGRAEFVAGDLSRHEANRKLVDKAVSAFGGVDLLVMSTGEMGLGSVAEVTPEVWDRTLATNLSALYYLMHYAVPQMQERGGGSVVVIGSIAGYKVFPNHAAYCASKGGVLQLVRQAALDLGPKIRVNAIHPGQVDTPLLWFSARAFPNPEEIIQQTADRLPAKRLGTPEDIASVAVFLAGEEASWITGSNVVVDGGSLCLP
ncbi:MAG: glucose 1-dehydrogenase [Spirochaetales bacterium]|nr:glucose 1-dehydrogenase [Spirochaetales bacterium]